MISHILSTSLLIQPGFAMLQSFQPTNNCRDVSAVGQQWFCQVNGVYKPALAKKTFCQICTDTNVMPLCDPDEIMFSTPIYTYATSEDSCVSGTNVPWIACQYSWQCCKCPATTVNNAAPPGYCSLFQYFGCYNCSAPGEVLIPNPSSNPTCAIQSSSTSSATSTRHSSTMTSVKSSSSSTCSSVSSMSSLPSANPPQPSNAICKTSEYASCPKAHLVAKKNKKGKTIKQYVCDSDPSGNTLAGCPKQCFFNTPPTCSQKFPQRCCWPDQDGVNFTKTQEAFCSTFYNEGDNVKTIGWGHNCNVDSSPALCNSLTLPIDTCIGENLLAADFQRLLHEAFRPLPNAKLLTQGQLNALLDLVFQCGNSAIQKGTPIWNDMQAGRADLVCGHITAQGTGSAACQSNTKRRLAEQAKCNAGSKVALGCSFANA